MHKVWGGSQVSPGLHPLWRIVSEECSEACLKDLGPHLNAMLGLADIIGLLGEARLRAFLKQIQDVYQRLAVAQVAARHWEQQWCFANTQLLEKSQRLEALEARAVVNSVKQVHTLVFERVAKEQLAQRAQALDVQLLHLTHSSLSDAPALRQQVEEERQRLDGIATLCWERTIGEHMAMHSKLNQDAQELASRQAELSEEKCKLEMMRRGFDHVVSHLTDIDATRGDATSNIGYSCGKGSSAKGEIPVPDRQCR